MNQSQQVIELLTLEMAMPRKVDIAKVYYHGTDNENSGQSILRKHMIIPGSELGGISHDTKGLMNPVRGKTYITPHLRYAVIYALGGDILGSKVPNRWLRHGNDMRYGYLFVIPGSELRDIQPDEDSVGEMVYDGRAPSWLVDKMHRALEGEEARDDLINPETGKVVDVLMRPAFDALMDGEYAYFALGGKKVMPLLSDEEKLTLIDMGAHLANQGGLKFKEAWRFDKVNTPALKKDGRNFFDLAEQVK